MHSLVHHVKIYCRKFLSPDKFTWQFLLWKNKARHTGSVVLIQCKIQLRCATLCTHSYVCSASWAREH